jgi:iron complex transport system substrate-binding protein
MRRLMLLLNTAALLLPLAGAAEPQRIVSTAPSITEILFALGLGDRVAGVTTFCTYPAEAMKKPKIGGYANPSIEAILALRPDLVVVLRDARQSGAKLRSMGLNTIDLDSRDVNSIAGIYSSIERIGTAAGVPDRARELTGRLRSELDSVRARAAKLSRKRVMFLIGRTPRTLEGLIAVGKASFISELMEVAGGDNIFNDAVAPYPKVSIEEVLARNPDVILDMGDIPRESSITEQHKQSVVQLWRRYPALKAVRENAVYAVASDALVIAGPRAAEAARILARLLHPGAGF